MRIRQPNDSARAGAALQLPTAALSPERNSRSRKLADVRRADLQRLIDEMQGAGAAPSTIRNTINAARALYRYVTRLELVHTDPTDGLALPAVRARRDRIADPVEAGHLIAALGGERALWGTAMYAGLRLGGAPRSSMVRRESLRRRSSR